MTSLPSANTGKSNGGFLHLSYDWEKILKIKPFAIPVGDPKQPPLLTTRNATKKMQIAESKAESKMGSIAEEADSDVSNAETQAAEPAKPKAPTLTTCKTREELASLLAKDGTIKLQAYALANQIGKNDAQLTPTQNSIKPITHEFSHLERSLYNYLAKELHSRWLDDASFVSKDIANRARIARVAIQATIANKIKEFASTLGIA